MSKHDVVDLPSGRRVDLNDRFDVSACETEDDAWYLLQAIQEKILDIEFQVECFEEGYHPDGQRFSPNRPPPPMWMPRAKKALGWSRLQKSDAQREFQKIAKAAKEHEKRSRDLRIERQFVDVAKQKLSEDLFEQILTAAIERAQTIENLAA
ncbi:MAG: hypothetical protein AAGD43_09380 [Pseudomonadota bacterium]